MWSSRSAGSKTRWGSWKPSAVVDKPLMEVACHLFGVYCSIRAAKGRRKSWVDNRSKQGPKNLRVNTFKFHLFFLWFLFTFLSFFFFSSWCCRNWRTEKSKLIWHIQKDLVKNFGKKSREAKIRQHCSV